MNEQKKLFGLFTSEEITEQLRREARERKPEPKPREPQTKLRLQREFWSAVYGIATALAEWRDYNLSRRNEGAKVFLRYPYYRRSKEFPQYNQWVWRAAIVYRPYLFWIQVFKPIMKRLHSIRDLAVSEGMKVGMYIIEHKAQNPEKPFYE